MAELNSAVAVREAGTSLKPTSLPENTRRAGWVRIRVAASGVCSADIGSISSDRPASGFPIVAGHEIAGTVDMVGYGVTRFAVDDRVAVGWLGGFCGECSACRAGDPVHCPDRQVTGVHFRGGWAQYVDVPVEALARIPSDMSFTAAAPFGCAGVTVFNAIRRAGICAGGRVAVFGLGGLGHLAVQFAAALGFETIAMARGTARAAAAAELGARHYVDVSATDPGEALTALGGADLILYSASATEPATLLLPGLTAGGRLVFVGVDGGAVAIPVGQLVTQGVSVTGHLAGSPQDTEEAMRFAAAHGVAPVVERFPLRDAADAVARLRSGEVRFRAVLEPWA